MRSTAALLRARLDCFAALHHHGCYLGRPDLSEHRGIGAIDPKATLAALGNECRVAKSFRYPLTDIEGKNLHTERRAAEGSSERLPALANELVALGPDVIVAVATPAIAAAQRATSTIPIVMTPATDPIGSGFIKSLSHPGGNITGVANLFGDLTGKSVEILHTFLPNARKVAVLMSLNPTHPAIYEAARGAAESLGLSTVPIVAATPAELERAFKDIAKAKCDAVFVLADPPRLAIVSLAVSAGLPSVYQFSEFVDHGGLVSYGPNVASMFRKSAHYVDRILQGSRPADLPVEQPTTFELVLNLKAAKLLGLSLPESLIARADRVIE